MYVTVIKVKGGVDACMLHDACMCNIHKYMYVDACM